MNGLLLIVLAVAIVLMGIGFWLGWFVRGSEVKKLKEGYKRLIQHALDAGWVVSEKQLWEGFVKHGLYVPYIPLQVSDADDDYPGRRS